MFSSKNNIKKISLIYSILTITFILCYEMQFKWNDTIVINALPTDNWELLQPIRETITTYMGTFGDTIYNILLYQLGFAIFILLPISLWHFVKGVWDNGKGN